MFLYNLPDLIYLDKVVGGILNHSLTLLILLNVLIKFLLQSYTHILKSLASNL